MSTNTNVSLASNENPDESQQIISDPEKGPEKEQETALKDRFHLIGILFFLCGIIQQLPSVFVSMAHDYWMYKFRDPSYENYDPNDLTMLERNFNTFTSVVGQGCAISMSIFALFFANRLSHRFKSFYTLIGIFIMYILLIAMIKVDTDSWQLPFFVLVMIFVGLLTMCCYMFAMYVMTLIAVFSTAYLGPNLAGQSSAIILSSIIQVLSLAIGTSTINNAIVYFSIGTGIIVGFIIYLQSIERTNRMYKIKLVKVREVQNEQKTLTFAQCWKLVKKMYPALLNMAGFLLTIEPIHPSVTSIIGSVNQNNGNIWNSKFFIPVIAFMLPSFCDIIGRIVAFILKDVIPLKYVITFSLIRPFIFIPLIILCNVPNKTYLPIVFNEDYEYILIMIAFTLTNGYSMGMTVFMVPKLVKPEEMDDALRVFMVIIGVLMAGSAYLGFITVNLI